MKEFRGRVAVVTGAAGGIGLAMGRRFAQEGMKVVISDVEEAPLKRAADALVAEGHEAIGVACDVRFFDSVKALADATLSEFGAVHVVCNNAGVARAPGGGYMWDFDLNDWNWILSVNVMGVVHGIKAFVPILLEQGDEGHIVNTTSGNGGIAPMRALPIYAASKTAVTQITECLYGQLAAVTDKVKTSLLFPGPGALNTGLWNAERNRPQELPQSRPRKTNTFERLRKKMGDLGVEVNETPLEDVAEFVLEGIREERFWMLHKSDRSDASIQRRADSMLQRTNPDYMITDIPVEAGGMGEVE